MATPSVLQHMPDKFSARQLAGCWPTLGVRSSPEDLGQAFTEGTFALLLCPGSRAGPGLWGRTYTPVSRVAARRKCSKTERPKASQGDRTTQDKGVWQMGREECPAGQREPSGGPKRTGCSEGSQGHSGHRASSHMCFGLGSGDYEAQP